MEPRFDLACLIALGEHSEFAERIVRNTGRVDGSALASSEPAAWDAAADLYWQRVDQ